MSFQSLHIIPPIATAITAAGYQRPTPIQEKAIPVILQGKDVLACAQTGTGKTAAFAIPILQRLQQRQAPGKGVAALVLTPTRELAIQIHESFNTYNQQLSIRSEVIVGGVSSKAQIAALKKNPEIIIATPGRLLDLVQQGFLQLGKIETVVLDEADTMLDMGFINAIKQIWTFLPKKKQTLFFSATIPKSIRKFAMSILYRPTEIIVSPVSSTVDLVAQQVCFIDQQDKKKSLISLLKSNEGTQTLVFIRTKHAANRLVKQLETAGITAAAIHGNKSQNTRLKALQGFKDETLRVLIATDIAARGIDIEGLPLVINFDLPNVPETYVHRIGRTGRAGMTGNAISFCDFSEKPYLQQIEKLTGNKIPVFNITSDTEN